MQNRVLVTGADQHQGLAVIRGLGQAGIPVVAASPVRRAIGHASRHAAIKATYTPPLLDERQFIQDILALIERYRVGMVIPVVESTLVVLDREREAIERRATLVAPAPGVLEWAIDKLRTVELAGRVGVPVPRTVYAAGAAEALEQSRAFRFPVALKPRGNPLHRDTAHRLPFKVKYARTRQELERILRQAEESSDALPLIQEYVPGGGINVSVLFDGDRPLMMVPYEKVREVPLTGGVSVVRRTVPMDPTLAAYIEALLAAARWRGPAMVEFKFDPVAGAYVLMEINGRFCASTALSLDAGVNWPCLTYRLFAGLPVDAATYCVGIHERWLRGDLRALGQHLSGRTAREATREACRQLPSRGRALLDFVADFRRGMHYDEFRRDDPLPGLREVAKWIHPPDRYRAVLGRRLMQLRRRRPAEWQ